MIRYDSFPCSDTAKFFFITVFLIHNCYFQLFFRVVHSHVSNCQFEHSHTIRQKGLMIKAKMPQSRLVEFEFRTCLTLKDFFFGKFFFAVDAVKVLFSLRIVYFKSDTVIFAINQLSKAPTD